MNLNKAGILRVVVLGTWFGALLWLESRQPIRAGRDDKKRRLARNGAIAGLGGVVLQMIEQPLVMPLSRLVESRRIGVLQRLRLPEVLNSLLAILAMDYTLYWWHVLAHKVPLLWRFHLVHHVDLDLDASTAIRFHFGELLISIAWRLLQIVTIGVRPGALSIWQDWLMACILFHHSNINLPAECQRILGRILVTPDMHTIHHSITESETNSNWSSGLTCWDHLHRTYRDDVNVENVVVGIPAYQRQDEFGLVQMLLLPFVHQRPSWQFELQSFSDPLA